MHAQCLVLPNPTAPVVTAARGCWQGSLQVLCHLTRGCGALRTCCLFSCNPEQRRGARGDAVLSGLATAGDSSPVRPMCQDAQTPKATRCEDGNQRCCWQEACTAEARGGVIPSGWQVPLTALAFRPDIPRAGCWDCWRDPSFIPQIALMVW